MLKALIGAALLGISLAGLTSTASGAEEYVVHTFRCPEVIKGHTAFPGSISSDPTFRLTQNVEVDAYFWGSYQSRQEVGCQYTLTSGPVRVPPAGTHVVWYTYTVDRKILSCDQSLGGNLGPREFTCKLKP